MKTTCPTCPACPFEGLDKFLDILFDPTESIWIHGRYRSYKTSSDQSCLKELNEFLSSEDGYLVGLNPAKALGCRHSKENVGKLRNILIEIDDISIEAQYKLITSARLPYSTMVYSGGKSLHTVISVEEGLESEEEYNGYIDRIRFALSNLPDPQIHKASFTRLPGFYRIQSRGLRKQALVDLKGRVKKADLDRFLERYKNDYLKELAIREFKSDFRASKKSYNKNSYANRIEAIELYLYNNRYTQHGNDQYSTRCPHCAENGRDNNSSNLSINLDKHLVFCHNQSLCDFSTVMLAMEKWIKENLDEEDDM